MKKIILILIFNCDIIIPSNPPTSPNDLCLRRKHYNSTPTPQESQLNQQATTLAQNPLALTYFQETQYSTIHQTNSTYQEFCTNRRKRTEKHNQYLAEIQLEIEKYIANKPELSKHPFEKMKNIDDWESNEGAWLALTHIYKKITLWETVSPEMHESISTESLLTPFCSHQDDEAICSQCEDHLTFIENYLKYRDPIEFQQ